MDKMRKVPEMVVRDPRTGETVVVQGAGAMKDRPLNLRKGIDLTKPIAEQVSKIKRKGRS
jgi:hypothetical protein